MNVLLVDDEPLALEFLKAQLTKVNDTLNIHTATVLDIEEAEDRLQATDVLFLDIEMPHINGLALAEQIIERYPELPIIFVTAYHEYAIEAFEMNALDYILKPAKLDRLKKTLERIPTKKKTYQAKVLLRVSVCNEFQLEEATDQFRPIAWRTAKAQELFLYLLHHEGKTIQKSHLITWFWEGIEEDKAYAQLYTTIYYIRKQMLVYRGHFELKSVQQGYLLVTSAIEIDLKEWEREVLTAPPVEKATIQQHEQIMNRYTGGYLEAYDFTWAEGERFRLEQRWIEQAKKMAICYDQAHESEQAVKWMSAVVERRPEEEQAHFMLMQVYADLDYGLLVHHQYEQLEAALKILDIPPPPHIKAWYESWKDERADNT